MIQMININKNLKQDMPSKLKEWAREAGGLAIILFFAYSVFYILWSKFYWGGEGGIKLISHLTQISASVLISTFALRIVSQEYIDRKTRQAWLLITIAFFLQSISEVSRLLYAYTFDLTPFASPADTPYLLFYPILLCGLISLPHSRKTNGERIRDWLDASTIVVGGGMVLWYFILNPLALIKEDSFRQTIAYLAYPLCYLMTLLCIATILLKRQEKHYSAKALLLALTLSFVADTAYCTSSLQSTYLHGGFFDALRLISYWFFAFGAHLKYLEEKEPVTTDDLKQSQNAAKRKLSLLPYVSIVFSYCILLFAANKRWSDTDRVMLNILIICAVILTTLIITRQILDFYFDLRLIGENSPQQIEERFRSLVQNSSDVIAIVSPDAKIQYVSPSVERVFGYPPEDLLNKKLFDYLHPEDKTKMKSLLILSATQPNSTNTNQLRFIHSNGNWCYVENVSINLLHDANINGIVITIRDITTRKYLEDQLTQQAFHDPLTKLANRILLKDRIEHALKRSNRKLDSVVVLFLDLDNFKTVNDSLGHAAGDLLLIEVAKRLCECLRTEDTAARLGGDEFAVLLEDVDDIETAEVVARRIIESLQSGFCIGGKEVFVNTSIGITTSFSNDTADALLRTADVAMYTAKSNGKGHYEVFTPSMHDEVMNRLELEADLRRALEREEFKVFYQPILDIQTNRLSGMEALIRWEHPERGLVSPIGFIQLAEEMGLIVSIGRWVLFEACKQMKIWQDKYQMPLNITVNLSGRQFQQHNFDQEVADVIAKTDLPPETLVVEITESVMIQNTEETLRKLNRLKTLNINLAIDDFGTGYSSLSYLQRFPIDILKIDKSFIDMMGRDQNDLALVRAIIALGHTLKLKTVAEGIETIQQKEVLQMLGCEYGQGYLFSKPINAEAIDSLLTKQFDKTKPFIVSSESYTQSLLT